MPLSSKATHFCEIVVVGAGAAGLLAATRSAERGQRTLLLEKNRKPGVKILMSGGTRCNITHDCNADGIVAAFGSAGSFLHSSLATLGPRELISLLEDEGLAVKTEEAGKIFPQSNRAIDVLNALLRRFRRSGAELSLEEPVVDIKRDAKRFSVRTSRRTIICERLILTTGGKSYPGCGTTGDGYAWLARMGHSIRRPRPALVPLISNEQWVRDLKGITIPDVLLQVVDPNFAGCALSKERRNRSRFPPGVLLERRGSMLFTHFGISGPVVLDISRAVTGSVEPQKLIICTDFLPGVAEAVINQEIRSLARNEGKRTVATIFADKLPRRLVDALLARAEVAIDRRLAELSTSERMRIVEQLKRCKIHITGSRGFEKAEVTAGGVSLDEVDSRDMQSKLVPGLFLAGEILDLDGFIGGYNFQAAFSTGWLAGESA